MGRRLERVRDFKIHHKAARWHRSKTTCHQSLPAFDAQDPHVGKRKQVSQVSTDAYTYTGFYMRSTTHIKK